MDQIEGFTVAGGDQKKSKAEIPAIKMDFSADSDRLFIAFGSLRLEREIPPFEYQRTFEDLPVKKLFIRDLRKIFYLRGLPGIATEMTEIRDYLQAIRQREGIKKLVIFGGSAGGYVALLMGWLLAADEVHAFAPMTFLPTRRGMGWVELFYNRNWPLLSKQLQMIFDPRLPHKYYDLKKILRQDNGRTQYHIYYGAGVAADVHRARRMIGLPGVHLLAYDYDGHHIDHYLQETGAWWPIFQEAI